MANRDHPLYIVWMGMNQRCNYPAHCHYPSYGGRGITICEQWSDFQTFAQDMGERPDGFTLDRIDNDGDYTPDNCRWVSPVIQGFNRADYNPHGHQYIGRAREKYRVRLTLIPKAQHTRVFSTFAEADDYKADCLFEREVHMRLGLYK